MSLGIIEVITEWDLTLSDFPELDSKLRKRFEKILQTIQTWSIPRGNLEHTLLSDMTPEEVRSVLAEWELIFAKIIKEEFSANYGWLEAKEKFWNENKSWNFRVFWGHKHYNIVLDGLEKVYWRHLPRKSEFTDYITNRITVLLKYRKWIEEHYTNHREFLAPWESQD